MKKVLLIISLCLSLLFICAGCGNNSVEIQEADQEFIEIEYDINEPYGGDANRPEGALIDFLAKTETQYTLVTEPCGLMNDNVISSAKSIQKEPIDQEIRDNEGSSVTLEKVIDSAGKEVDLILNVDNPTNIMQMFGLGNEGRAEMEDYYGGFIKYYNDHKLKTSCNIRFEKLLYNPIEDNVPKCYAMKYVVDITTESGEGDLSKVEYIPPVGEMKTVDIYMVGTYENGCFYPHVLKIDNVEFGRAY